MTIDYERMVKNEQYKAVKLQQVALNLGMNLDEYIEIGVNQYNGNVWLFHYDFNFTLYMPLYGNDVCVMTTDNQSGEEFEEELLTIGMDIDLIEAWANRVVEEEVL